MLRIRPVAVTALLLAAGAVALPASANEPALRSAAPTVPSPITLRIMVTNDDGVNSPGLATLVDALQALPNVQVTVIAPATNQSGTSDTFSTTPITVAPATTANGDAATTVSGTPADTVLYGITTVLPQPPHVVVSGTNFGQNLGTVTTLSGTVGAARTANRLGVPAIATSAGIAGDMTSSYAVGAQVAAAWVQFFRPFYEDETRTAQTLNVNIPTCAVGSVRGLVLVPLAQVSTVGSYTLSSGTIGHGVFQPQVINKNPIATNIDCTQSGAAAGNDIDAFAQGFVTLSVLNPDLDDR